MLFRKLLCFTYELTYNLRCWPSFLKIFSLLSVVISKLLSHFSKKSVFQCLKFCETQYLRLIIWIAFNEIKNIALFILSYFRFCDVFKNFAQGVTQGLIVRIQAKALAVDFVKAIFVEKFPCFIAGPTVIITQVVNNSIEDNSDATILN